MSPSVLSSKNIILSSTNQERRIKPEVRRVQRTLFGPIDRVETKKFMEQELKKIIDIKSEEWNFNFKTESTLKPDGLFEWKLLTPRKQKTPIKRKVESEVDISGQYCELLDEVERARPIKCSSPTHNGEHKAQQSRITDFMKATKRPLSCDVSKKPSSSERPTKIPRLDIVS